MNVLKLYTIPEGKEHEEKYLKPCKLKRSKRIFFNRVVPMEYLHDPYEKDDQIVKIQNLLNKVKDDNYVIKPEKDVTLDIRLIRVTLRNGRVVEIFNKRDNTLNEFFYHLWLLTM